jgi:deoxyribodipyrimidine photo-lyase
VLFSLLDINRLNNYFYLTDNISRYKETRNGLLSADYSSKFSAWLANGSLSPRFIYWKLKEYEKERINNQSTYWLLFELLWRDYFKFVAMKYGKKIFFKSGLRKKTTEYSNDFNLFQKWINGDTNEKFVNANMIELKESGFMSNRGRQNVMSYLVHDLGIDWRWGAEYFESMLIDYDVESNWGNSQYIAGVGNDPRENRKFNIKRQQDMYDPENKYINYWLAKG